MELERLLAILAVVLLLALALAVVVLVAAWRRLRRVRVSPHADFFTTVRAVPLSLVIGLDLLDIALDVFSTPITFLLLDRLGLRSLRNIATIKAIIPIVDAIPLLTLAWFAARLFKLGNPYDPNLIETERVGPDRYVPRP
ncbi:MAG TPA: hypothetical protein VHR45_23295 [Thermoanaerobaculia bacterium]|nr:hypothetical protein [Thermoanaerobaculia bacterium]